MKPFIKKLICDLCRSSDISILISVDFMESCVFDFLSEYYENRIPEKYLEGYKFEVVKCNSCSFIWQANILNENLTHKLYNEWISVEDSLSKKKYADFDFFNRYYEEIKTISDLINKKPHQTKVLDFGMGWGYWCLLAKAFGFDVVGYDISPDRVAYASNNGINVLDHQEIYINDQFDFINAEQVFEHINNPLNTLKELTNSLRVDGIIRISVPNGNYIDRELENSDWAASHDAIHPLEHINCFTSNSLITMIDQVGLVPIDVILELSTKNGYYPIIKRYFRYIFSRNKQTNSRHFPKYFKKIRSKINISVAS